MVNAKGKLDDRGGNQPDSRLHSTDLRGQKYVSLNKTFDHGGLSRADRDLLDQLANFFSTLFEETQMTDVDEIIDAIRKAETEEETLNEEISDTNKAIELLEQSIADERKRMSGLKQLTPEEMDKLKEAQRLDDQIHKNEELMKNYDKKMAAISNNLKTFKVV
jgi:chromosome segregation ATPase